MNVLREGLDPSNIEPPKGPSRRAILGWAGGTIAAGMLAGGAVIAGDRFTGESNGLSGDREERSPGTRSDRSSTSWEGSSQPGIDRPATPQSFCRLAVFQVTEEVETLELLAAIGARIAELTSAKEPYGDSDLTVIVGLGPELVRRVGNGLAGSEDLPRFLGDESIDSTHNGGDLMLLCAASDPTVLSVVLNSIATAVSSLSLRWEQFGFRGPSEGTRTRNPLGFHDGVIVPKTDDELMEHVWFGARHQRSTICVVRRFALEQEAFHALSVAERERTVGRDLDGRPLSGGEPFDEVDLMAKRPNGEFLIPVDAHVRLAHPSFTASNLMLRRSYAYDNGDESGLLFISYQKDLRTFVETQRRMDEQGDAMMRFARPTASATFLIVPAQNGDTLFGEGLLALEDQANGE